MSHDTPLPQLGQPQRVNAKRRHEAAFPDLVPPVTAPGPRQTVPLRARPTDRDDPDDSPRKVARRDDDEPSGPLDHLDRWADPKKRSLPIAAGGPIAEEVWNGLPAKSFVNSGQKQAGFRPSDPANTIERLERPYAGERVTQLLTHVSDVLLASLKQGNVDGVVEVQAMFVNGRLLLSENTQTGREKLVEKLETVALDLIASEVRESLRADARAKLMRRRRAKSAPTEEQVTDAIPPSKRPPHRHAGKLGRGLRGRRRWQLEPGPHDEDTQDAESLIRILQTRIEGDDSLVLRRSADAPGIVDDDRYANKIIIVDSPHKKFHAEQTLMWALKKSSSTAAATISGVRRPCLGCYLTFKLMTEVYKAKITYNNHTGFAWAESIRNLPQFIAEAHRRPDDARVPIGMGRVEVIDRDVVEQLSTFLMGAVPEVAHVTVRPGTRTGTTITDPGHVTDSDSEEESDDLSWDLSEG